MEPNGWYYFNKAQQAIWAGDIEKARSFLRQAKNIFMVEKEKYDISIHKSKNEKVHIEWNEIIKKAKTNIIIHTADYIGEAFIVFEPWFLVRGSMMCGSWNPYKPRRSN